MPFRIGPHDFCGGPWLAPLASVSSAPFRRICAEQGCEQAVTEMVACESLVRSIEKNAQRMMRARNERVLTVQLFGASPDTMAVAARIAIDRAGADIIDINMGCPVRKILTAGAGAALMKDPEQAATIVRSVARASSPVPVTVKIRAGWDNNINAVDIAKRVVDAGASGIAIHARTREQYHAGPAQWDVIAGVKNAVSVPVIGNGGIKTAIDASDMIEQTGCDAVMVGRGSLGNPWVFRSICEGREHKPTIAERFEVIRNHASLLIAHAGNYTGLREMRKHYGWYLRGLPGNSDVKKRLQILTTEKEVRVTLDQYENTLSALAPPTVCNQ